MRIVTLLLLSLTCKVVLAEQAYENDFTNPSVELVTTIHEFCLEQHSVQNEPDIEKYILDCVNTDLEISSYKTFNTYAELTAFITTENGE